MAQQATETKTVTSFNEAWIERNPEAWRRRSAELVDRARVRGWNMRMERMGHVLHLVAWDPALCDGGLEL